MPGNERAAEHLQRFFGLSTDMIGIAGFDGYFKELGLAWEQTLGFTREELLAVPYVDFIHPDDRAPTIAKAAELTVGQVAVSFENRYRRRDGSYCWLEWNATSYPDEGLMYFIARDVSQRKQTEDELAEKNRLLAEEIAERARTEEVLRRQQEALRAMSTPIIQAWDGVLVLPVIGMLDSSRVAQMMERLLAEISRMGARFAVLDLTGVEAVDTSTVAHLLRIVKAASLLGSRCLVSGISPSVAQTVVTLGVPLESLMTFGLLQDALRHAVISSGGASGASGPSDGAASGKSPRRDLGP
jgi:PAS domain S-box-containing protein